MAETTRDGGIELGGEVRLPGDKGAHRATLSIDKGGGKVSVRFEEPLGGSDAWDGSSVVVTRRLKYHEVVFNTVGLPVESLELTWKMNVALNERMAAGVVLARPNEMKVKGEHGFTLVAGGDSMGGENYLTQLPSRLYKSMRD